jgi:hypothetical protein
VNNLVLRFLFAAALLMQSCLVCGSARAQNQSQTDFRTENSNASAVVALASPVAAQFPATDVSLTAGTPFRGRGFTPFAVTDPGNLAAYSPLTAISPEADSSRTASTAQPSPEPAPSPSPKPYSYNENPNKWQLGITFALVRFRSSVYFASAPGFNTSLAYWFKDGMAIEASVTTAFAPPVFANEHFRYLSYAAGPKFAFGHGRLQPWAHALAGGVHLIPQTASGGQNGIEFLLGGGVDYPINGVISAKAGVDYLGTHMFGEWQSSVQILAGFSFRF